MSATQKKKLKQRLAHTTFSVPTSYGEGNTDQGLLEQALGKSMRALVDTNVLLDYFARHEPSFSWWLSLCAMLKKDYGLVYEEIDLG